VKDASTVVYKNSDDRRVQKLWRPLRRAESLKNPIITMIFDL